MGPKLSRKGRGAFTLGGGGGGVGAGPSLAPIFSWGNTPIQGEFSWLEGTVAVEEGWFLDGVSAVYFAWYETNLVPEGWLLEPAVADRVLLGGFFLRSVVSNPE